MILECVTTSHQWPQRVYLEQLRMVIVIMLIFSGIYFVLYALSPQIIMFITYLIPLGFFFSKYSKLTIP